MPAGSLKDDGLAALAAAGNVAQFASFAPGRVPTLRHSRILTADSSEVDDVESAIRALFGSGAESVNVRSFAPGQDKGNPFEYGIESADAAVSVVRRLSDSGRTRAGHP